MNARRIWAVARKEGIHIIRDWRSLVMGIAIPILLLTLFGYALTLDVDEVPLVVWDQGGTQASRDFISRFEGSPYFALRRVVQTYAEVERAIDAGEALVALVIPVDFAMDVGSGRVGRAQAIVDGSDSNTATIVLGYVETVARTYNQDLAIEQAARTSGRTVTVPLDLRQRVWFNADMESKNYIIPGLIAVIMMVIAAMLTSLTVAREWETGTMEQVISTPLKGPELILGKLLPYFSIGMLDVLVAVLMGEFLFEVPLRGNVALLFGMAAVFLAGALSLGMLISIVTKAQLLASQLAMVVTFLPAFLLSGFMYDISNMPNVIQVLTHVVPARYFVSLLKGIYLKGVGLELLMMEAVLLAVFGLLVLLAANLVFKKKMA
ncbi:MAG: ABC transporter permease [Nitrospira sp.]|nr:ABC transporter permease [Nitrospira sp.]